MSANLEATTATTPTDDLSAHSFRMLINGSLVDAAETFDVINPATEEILAASPVASVEQLNEAVRAAKQAFPAWTGLPVAERGALLEALAEAIEERADEFARLVTLEQGKPLAASRGDVDAAIAFTRAFAALRPGPEVVRDDDQARIEIHHKPLGVVLAILPWNFPFFQGMYKLAPALLTGNTLVIKPSPTTPLNAMLLGELLVDLFPAGVVNIIGDGGSAGPVLTGHPDVAKISFTGSTAVGKAVLASAASTLKRVTLELGGNDPAIVLDDAEVRKTAAELFKWAFANSGQVCINIKRIYAHSSIYDELCDEIARLAKAAKIGPGLEPDTDFGPLQNAKQFQAAKGYLQLAKEQGTIIAGGNVLDRPGYFVEPTVVRDIGEDSPLVTQETFAPIRSIMSYDDLEDAIARANNSAYGLGASVWGADIERAAAVADRLECGTSWVNQHFALQPDVPFGGRKQSGLGVEFGTEGVNEFTDVHVLNIAKN
ncbi:aldehyde dehydrogenase family protein [Arthrobacter sp. NPDC058127]|uniref:aldehyde dehydrogenase family protein n=1 Tax=Arthrobacter sp. NPDC058127 TaxID=3346351 RepID=UPI0036EEF1F4